MWRLIEARLRRQAVPHAVLYAATWGLAVAASSLEPALRTPERLAATAGVLAVVLAFFAHNVIRSLDARESRASLHFALPVPLRELIARRIIEPVLLPSLLAAVSAALALAGRLGIGGEVEWLPLAFLVAILAFILLMIQVTLLVEECQRRLVSLRSLIMLAMVVVLGGGGAAVGYLIGHWARIGNGHMADTFAVFSQGDVTLALLAITLLIAGLNWQLLASRQSYLD